MSCGPNLRKLLEIASPAVLETPPAFSANVLMALGERSSELVSLLEARNGFYAFESALHVFPAGDSMTSLTLEGWNSPTLWRSEYHGLADDCVFFSEDAFGGQFCIASGAVFSFNAETGEREHIGATLDDWASALLQRHRLLTGWPLAHDWQARYGMLPIGRRLIPKLPFVLGGAYSVENLRDGDAVKAMRFYGDLAGQIRSLPDGAQVRLRTVS